MNKDTKIYILSGLIVGLEAAESEANEYHRTMGGFNQYGHDSLDEKVSEISKVIDFVRTM
jgi:hypothetical protein